MKTPQTVAGLKKDEPAIQSTAHNDKAPGHPDDMVSMLQQVEEIFSQEEAQFLGAIHGTDKEPSKPSTEAQGISQAGLIKRDINPLIDGTETITNTRCVLEFLADAVAGIEYGGGGWSRRTEHGLCLLLNACSAALADVETKPEGGAA